jgi:hypothetical protein
MEISHNNPVIWLAYLPQKLEDKFNWDFNVRNIPERISLCKIFWRSLFIPPIFLIVILLGLAFTIVFSPVWILCWLFTETEIGYKVENAFARIKTSGLVEVFRSFKNRVCPIVEIKK